MGAHHDHVGADPLRGSQDDLGGVALQHFDAGQHAGRVQVRVRSIEGVDPLLEDGAEATEIALMKPVQTREQAARQQRLIAGRTDRDDVEPRAELPGDADRVPGAFQLAGSSSEQ